MLRILILLFLAFGCSNSSRGTLRIGVDPNWYPLNFGPQTSYVNGFTEELLIEMARYSGIEFERVPANWDTLMDGLRERKYDAVLTSMQPYSFNKAKYDFSSNFLELGPVLVVPIAETHSELSQMDGKKIGIISADPSETLLAAYPTILIRSYPSVPELLNAVVSGDIEGAVLDRIPAVNYTNDLYATRLKISGAPLTNKGLHLVAPKNATHLVALFNKNLDSFKRKKSFEAMLKKWQLD